MTKQATAAAFVNGRTAKCHNAHTDGTTYTLHKSVIARKEGDRVIFDWCGFYTPTTASHMNAILKELNAGFRVSYASARDNAATTFKAGYDL